MFPKSTLVSDHGSTLFQAWKEFLGGLQNNFKGGVILHVHNGIGDGKYAASFINDPQGDTDIPFLIKYVAYQNSNDRIRKRTQKLKKKSRKQIAGGKKKKKKKKKKKPGRKIVTK